MNITMRNAVEFEHVIIPYIKLAVTHPTCQAALSAAFNQGTDGTTIMLLMKEHLGKDLEVNTAEHQHIYEMLKAYFGLGPEPVPHQLVRGAFITQHIVVAIRHLRTVGWVPSEAARLSTNREMVRREIGSALVNTRYPSLMPHNKDLEVMRLYFHHEGLVNQSEAFDDDDTVKPSFGISNVLYILAKHEHILPTPQC